MKLPTFFLSFSKGQRRAILLLLGLIVFIQLAFYLISIKGSGPVTTTEEEKQWLALQPRLDSLRMAHPENIRKVYPFNPNFISDHKGYMLGLTTGQIDKLHAFRNSGKFVDSPADFQRVTGVHDTVLARISPYFKFPDWVVKKQREKAKGTAMAVAGNHMLYEKPPVEKAEKKVIRKDINAALEEDLVQVYGIGPAFAKKILRRRATLGAFVSMEQLEEFPEFSAEAVAGLKKHFDVIAPPKVEKLNVNSASLHTLSGFPYFTKDLARAIITRRSMRGKISHIDELLKINQFPVDKEKIIALYLEF